MNQLSQKSIVINPFSLFMLDRSLGCFIYKGDNYVLEFRRSVYGYIKLIYKRSNEVFL